MMTLRQPEIGKLKCNNRNCGREFEVQDFHSNRNIRCPHCGQTSQYRTQDYISANDPKKEPWDEETHG